MVAVSITSVPLTSPVVAEIIGFQDLSTSCILLCFGLGSCKWPMAGIHTLAVKSHAVGFFFHPVLVSGLGFLSHSPLCLGPAPKPQRLPARAPAQHGPPLPSLSRSDRLLSSRVPTPQAAPFADSPSSGPGHGVSARLHHPRCGSPPVPVRGPGPVPPGLAGHQGR